MHSPFLSVLMFIQKEDYHVLIELELHPVSTTSNAAILKFLSAASDKNSKVYDHAPQQLAKPLHWTLAKS